MRVRPHWKQRIRGRVAGGARGLAFGLSLLLGLASFALLLAPRAQAQDARSTYLIGLLRDSDMFRVRTQAAISLGRVHSSTPVIQALGRALRDDHPSVRAAAASSLGRLGDPNALAVLRAMPPDTEASVRASVESAIASLSNIQGSGPRTVPLPAGGGSGGAEPPPEPSGPARYYVGVGLPGSRVDGLDRELLTQIRDFLRQRVGGIDGVRLAPDNERPRAAERVMRDDELEGYFLDSAVVSLAPNGGGVRAQVSVVLQSYPDRNIRSTLSGAATVTGGGASAQRQAIEHAFLGALRSLPRVMEATTGGIARGGGRRRHH